MKEILVPNHHDKLFKAIFGQPQHAAVQFRALLPAPVVAALDLEQATLQPGTFVTDELRNRHTDLLYRVPFLDESSDSHDEVYLYILFEHQSTVDEWMCLRLLDYIVRIWEDFRQKNPKAKHLPPIFPLVLYQGQNEWTAATQIQSLLAIPEHLKPTLGSYFIHFSYIIEDLVQQPDHKLPGPGLVRLVLLLFKYIHHPDFPTHMMQWTEDIQRVIQKDADGLHSFSQVVEYIFRVREADESAIIEALSRVSRQAQEVAMSIADRLVAKGHKKGHREGLDEGLEKGRAEGLEKGRTEGRTEGLEKGRGSLADAVLKLIELRYGPPNASAVEKVQSASFEQLERWAKEVLNTASIEELFQK